MWCKYIGVTPDIFKFDNYFNESISIYKHSNKETQQRGQIPKIQKTENPNLAITKPSETKEQSQ